MTWTPIYIHGSLWFLRYFDLEQMQQANCVPRAVQLIQFSGKLPKIENRLFGGLKRQSACSAAVCRNASYLNGHVAGVTRFSSVTGRKTGETGEKGDGESGTSLDCVIYLNNSSETYLMCREQNAGMPRRSRCVLSGVPYHITQRGVDKCVTFSTEEDHQTYLRLLRDNLSDAKVRLLGWCMMSNHVHVIAIPGREDSLAVLFPFGGPKSKNV